MNLVAKVVRIKPFCRDLKKDCVLVALGEGVPMTLHAGIFWACLFESECFPPFYSFLFYCMLRAERADHRPSDHGPTYKAMFGHDPSWRQATGSLINLRNTVKILS